MIFSEICGRGDTVAGQGENQKGALFVERVYSPRRPFSVRLAFGEIEVQRMKSPGLFSGVEAAFDRGRSGEWTYHKHRTRIGGSNKGNRQTSGEGPVHVAPGGSTDPGGRSARPHPTSSSASYHGSNRSAPSTLPGVNRLSPLACPPSVLLPLEMSKSPGPSALQSIVFKNHLTCLLPGNR